MAKITKEQVCIAYEVSRKVFSKETSRTEGIGSLVSEHNLNKATSGDFIQCFKCMLEGRVFQRAMSQSAMDYFLGEIYSDFSSNYLQNSVRALDLHIDYWESHYQTNAISMRKISSKYKEILEKGRTSEFYQNKLISEVQESLTLSREERLIRISASEAKPKRLSVNPIVYQRNPDVVAESLARSDGKCERCKNKAPFNRLKDGTPYLEVHHVIRLADGGLDVLDNTLAVCPNCHRELHFG
jgi:5-methylcytosine-specific restriction protein A